MIQNKTDSLSQLDRYLPEAIRTRIEQRYLVRINDQARMEQVIHDPNFYQDPEEYPPFYADHGVIHHRDVALQILHVLETIHGLLIPARDHNRLEFMKGYGVAITYLHDIGMADFSAFGRAMHPEVATQTAFSPDFEEILQAIWEQNCGNLAWRLSGLAGRGALEQEPFSVLRELLAMVICHSKSRVPVHFLNDPEQLRRLMQERAGTPLSILYQEYQITKARQALMAAQDQQDHAAIDRFARQLYEADLKLQACQHESVPESDPSAIVRRHYTDFENDSFRWLATPRAETQALTRDVVDTLRVLRCADALRQRGAVLKTSGGYEVFVDQGSANAILALRLKQDELFLLEISDTLSAGEANIASSQIDQDGNLRISFHRGAFRDPTTIRQAAYNAAVVVNDIQADAIESFEGAFSPQEGKAGDLKTIEDIEILLEGVADNLEFADLVIRELALVNPQAADRVRGVPSLQDASPIELDRYLQAPDLEWDLDTRRQALERIEKSGHHTAQIDLERCFKGVKVVRLKAGTILVEAGASSSFVYIPLGEGLHILPMGGYASFPVNPWMPLGITGVIRGAARNATIIAELDLALLMIPKEVYLREWHHTHSVEELTETLALRVAKNQEQEQTTLSRFERIVILQTVPLFAEIPEATLNELADIVQEIHFKADENIIEKGDTGNSMYVIADGQVRVHSGEQTLNYLNKGDVFGEMALLDPEPRIASVTALKETKLLLLEREAFLGLMAQHIEVAQGIIGVLLQRLRARAQDVAELRARLEQLESEATPLSKATLDKAQKLAEKARE